MSLETRIASLATAIGVKMKEVLNTLSGKVNSSGNTPSGYLRTDSLGEVVVDTTPLAPITPSDNVEYVMRNGVWVELQHPTSVEWTTGILNKPSTFTPSVHTHDDLYYTELEVDTLLLGKAESVHSHNDVYYTETEIDNLLLTKENSFTKNTGFNKNFGTTSGTVSEGNHNHNTIYFTKGEILTLLSTVEATGHNHNDIYYTKVQVDDLLQSNLSSTHNHNDIYYTEGEIDTLLLNKANSNHNHDDRYYTESEIDAIVLDLALKEHTHEGDFYSTEQVDDLLQGKASIVHNHDDRYFTETEVTNRLNALKLDLESQIVSESSVTPLAGIQVILSEGKTFGKYTNGSILPGNTSLVELVRSAVQEYSPAIFTQPSVVLSGSPSPTVNVEKGYSFDLDLTSTFSQNDAGAPTTFKVFRNNIEVFTSPSVNTYTETVNDLPTESSLEFKSVVSYSGGSIQRENSLGELENNTIVSGNITSNILSYKSYWPLFLGSTATEYSTSTQIRTNLSKVLILDGLETFTLSTGTSNKIFQFWIPTDFFTLDSVVDIDAVNSVITSHYVSQPLDVEDAGGNLMSGELYTLSADVPYSKNHRHIITISR